MAGHRSLLSFFSFHFFFCFLLGLQLRWVLNELILIAVWNCRFGDYAMVKSTTGWVFGNLGSRARHVVVAMWRQFRSCTGLVSWILYGGREAKHGL
jgi:hypothetical protein